MPFIDRSVQRKQTKPGYISQYRNPGQIILSYTIKEENSEFCGFSLTLHLKETFFYCLFTLECVCELAVKYERKKLKFHL